MQKRKLDVLVTFYNQEKYVDRVFASIFSQECKFDFNVLVGDDGSTDNTIQYVKKWGNKYPGRIEIFSMDREMGKKYIGGFRASRNRLNLLRHVISEYFIFLDGDDYYCDVDKFQKQIEILDYPENKDCVGCSHNINAAYPDGTVKVFNMMAIGEGKYGIHRYWFDLYFHTDTTIFRSSVINNLSLDLLENNFNDNMITYSIMQHGKLYFIPDTMAVYDQTGEGIWTGEKAIVNNIRNMFLYDLCIKMNKKLEFQTNVRFYGNWKQLFCLRKKIDSDTLIELQNEAVDKQLKNSLLWLKYDRISLFEKFYLCLVLIKVGLSSFIFRFAHRLLKFFKKAYLFFKKPLKCILMLRFQNLWKDNSNIEIKNRNNYIKNINLKKQNELGVEVAPVYGNKKGIITIISDDGDYETSIVLNNLAKDNDVPITIAGNVKNIAPHMGYWREVLREGNIELVNHSYNHYRMDEKWKYSGNKKKLIHEIVHSRLFFERQLGIGAKVFVCPENAICDLGYTVIKEDEQIAVRRGTRGLNPLDIKNGTNPGNWFNLMCYGIMDQPQPLDTRRQMRNKWLDEASNGKWLIEMWHNVDKKGYQSIDLNSAVEHLKDICKYKEEKNLWCAKFTDAVNYLKEKENARIHSWVEDGKIKVYISLDSYSCDSLHELTVMEKSRGIFLNLLPYRLYTIKDNIILEELENIC